MKGPVKEINRHSHTKASLAILVLSFLLFVGTFIFHYTPARAGSDAAKARRTDEESLIIETYKEAKEGVVFIATETLTVDPTEILPEIEESKGSGSGIIVDSERGIVLTNLHVIREAHKIQIILTDGQPYDAKLLGFDGEYDIAVLRILNPPSKLHALKYGDSSKLEVGQRVLAIGNPFGLDRTLTSGIVSSLDRAVKNPDGRIMRGLIQTDAAINPGNSGGPLLDVEGRLVGINSAILSQSGDSAGIGFAVPINQIKRVLPELIATGKVLRPKLGWMLIDTNQGPMVRRTLKGGPADVAGLQPVERMVDSVFVRGYVRDFARADLIYAVNGKRVYSKDDVDEIVSNSDPREPINFTVRRGGADGKERELTIRPVLG